MSLIKELHGKDKIVVFDDGSTFDADPYLEYCDFYRFQHKGRNGYWLQYQYMFEVAQESTDDWFMFIQDDISKVQLERIKEICDKLPIPYAFNFLRAGADRRWTDVIWTTTKDFEGYKMGYVDCNFCVPRKSLELLNFHMQEVSPEWLSNPFHSSGVGKQLSKRFHKLGVGMYMIKKSLAYHGHHESVMHTHERKRNPLVSV